MDLLLEFRIGGLPPSTNNLHKRSRFGMYEVLASKKYKMKMVTTLPKKLRLECPVVVLLEFHISSKLKFSKRDIDNFVKCTLDGLQLSGQIRNDNQVIFCAQMKVMDVKNFVLGWIYRMPDSPSLLHVVRELSTVKLTEVIA